MHGVSSGSRVDPCGPRFVQVMRSWSLGHLIMSLWRVAVEICPATASTQIRRVQGTKVPRGHSSSKYGGERDDDA